MADEIAAVPTLEYNAFDGKNLINTEQCTEIVIDTRTQSLDMITKEIISTINKQQHNTIKQLQKTNQNQKELITLLGIGAGLLLLNAFTTQEK